MSMDFEEYNVSTLCLEVNILIKSVEPFGISPTEGVISSKEFPFFKMNLWTPALIFETFTQKNSENPFDCCKLRSQLSDKDISI